MAIFLCFLPRNSAENSVPDTADLSLNQGEGKTGEIRAFTTNHEKSLDREPYTRLFV